MLGRAGPRSCVSARVPSCLLSRMSLAIVSVNFSSDCNKQNGFLHGSDSWWCAEACYRCRTDFTGAKGTT